MRRPTVLLIVLSFLAAASGVVVAASLMCREYGLSLVGIAVIVLITLWAKRNRL